MENTFNEIGYWFLTSGWSFLIAIGLLVASYFLIKLLSWLLKKILRKTSLDDAVIVFYVSLFKVILWILVIILCSNLLGFNTQYFVVALTGAIVAIGLALKDSLGNVANGIVIIYSKPFKRGDQVLINGVEGKVQNIKLLTTEIITFDNRKVVYPNNVVTTNLIVNYSSMATRRIDMSFSVAYGADLGKAQEVLEGIANSNEKIHKNPKPLICPDTIGDSSIDFCFKVWVNTEDYYDVKRSLPLQVYNKFMENNIKIPYSQIDVHVRND
jgi:small conductance mechanosensitive channel